MYEDKEAPRPVAAQKRGSKVLRMRNSYRGNTRRRKIHRSKYLDKGLDLREPNHNGYITDRIQERDSTFHTFLASLKYRVRRKIRHSRHTKSAVRLTSGVQWRTSGLERLGLFRAYLVYTRNSLTMNKFNKTLNQSLLVRPINSEENDHVERLPVFVSLGDSRRAILMTVHPARKS